MARGVKATAIHGDRSQNQRNQALRGFQDGQYRVLVATDVAARGIHVDNIAHVVNFDLPQQPEDFIHRVGRTGRAGAQGIASTFGHMGSAAISRTSSAYSKYVYVEGNSRRTGREEKPRQLSRCRPGAASKPSASPFASNAIISAQTPRHRRLRSEYPAASRISTSRPEGARLRQCTVPLHASTQFLTIASPRPTPPERLREVSTR